MAIAEHHNECACHATTVFATLKSFNGNDSYYNSISIEMNRLNVMNSFLVEMFLASMSENIYRFFFLNSKCLSLFHHRNERHNLK